MKPESTYVVLDSQANSQLGAVFLPGVGVYEAE